MSQFESSSAFGRVLNRILHEGSFTAVELAMEAGCSDRLIQYVASGEKNLAVDKAEKVARYLARHGDTRLAAVFLSPDFTVVRRTAGVANGCVKDEVIKIVHALSEAEGGHTRRDTRALEAGISHIRAALADLEAELAALEAGR